jgi:hypothetical protein
MITLNEEQVKQIEALLAEMPGKFCIPMLNILNAASKPTESEEEIKDVQS